MSEHVVGAKFNSIRMLNVDGLYLLVHININIDISRWNLRIFLSYFFMFSFCFLEFQKEKFFCYRLSLPSTLFFFHHCVIHCNFIFDDGKINYCIVSTGFSEFGWVLFASFKDVVGNIIWLGTLTFLPVAAVKFDV